MSINKIIGQTLFQQHLVGWQQPPHFIILQGEEGSGRSTLMERLKQVFKYATVTCGTSVDEIREIISLAHQLAEPTFYFFYQGDKLSLAAKNALLKVLEEPPQNAFFVMRSTYVPLNTLLNRAFYYQMQPYSAIELKQAFIEAGQPELYNQYGKVCRNIGQVKILIKAPCDEIVEYCDTIIDMIPHVVVGNVLNIPNKLNLRDKAERWDITLFLNILEWRLSCKYKHTKLDKYFQALYQLARVRQQLRITGVNKLAIFDNFFLGLHEFL